VSTNEVREDLLNLDPVEGGDTIYKPFNIQPIATVTEGIGNFVRGLFGDSDKKQSGVITMKTKAVGKDFDFGAPIRPRDTERAFIRKLNKELKHDIKNLIVTMLNQKQDGKKDTVTTGIKEETRVARWKTFMEHTNLYSQILKKIVQDLSKDQQKKVLQKLERRRVLIGDNKLDNAESIGFDLKAETSRWNNKIRPFIAKVIEERGNEELRELPLKAQNRLDMGREEVIDFLKNELGEKFVKEINQVTRDALIESIEAGLKAGEDYTELSNRVADIYGDLRGYRASRIGRTEVLRALNFGSMEAYRQSGVVEQKEWLATPDDRVRPSHAEADGQRVGLDEKFDVGGHKLNQPLDPNAPASETIHCRCTTIPITVYQQEIYDTIGEKTKEMKVEKVMNEVMQKIKEKKQQQKEIEQKVVDEQAKHISRASDKVKQKVWEEVYQEVKDSIKQRKQRLETKADEELMERESLVREEIRQAEKEIQKIKNKENHTRDELRRLEDIKLQQRAALNDELDNYKREQKKQTDKKVRQYRKKTIGQVKELQKKFDNKKKQVNQIDKKIKNKEKILDKAKQKANDIIEEAKNTAQKYRKGALDQFKILRDKVENVIKKDD
jgi:SPP1 gp7 family putative phage head morphogenesis protein